MLMRRNRRSKVSIGRDIGESVKRQDRVRIEARRETSEVGQNYLAREATIHHDFDLCGIVVNQRGS